MVTLHTRPPADLLDTRPRRGPIVAAVAAVLVLCVALAAGLAVLGSLLLGDRTGAERAAPAGPPPAPAAAPEPAVTVADRPLELPQPTGYRDGVPVGFPRTVPGAVAAAYGYSRVATGLDVQATLRALEQIAAPDSGWLPAERARLADGLVAQRGTLGLPPVGSAGQATIDVTPSGYQLADPDPDPDPDLDRRAPTAVTVLTLNVVSARAADGTRTSGTLAFRWDLRWDGSGWRAVRTFLHDRDTAIAVTPLTSAAAAAGWKDARGG